MKLNAYRPPQEGTIHGPWHICRAGQPVAHQFAVYVPGGSWVYKEHHDEAEARRLVEAERDKIFQP